MLDFCERWADCETEANRACHLRETRSLFHELPVLRQIRIHLQGHTVRDLTALYVEVQYPAQTVNGLTDLYPLTASIFGYQ